MPNAQTAARGEFIVTAATDGVPRVYRAIVGVSADIAKAGIPKDQRNQQQNYQFRGIDAVMNALAPLLAKHGLVILPRMLSRSVVEHASKSGGVLFYVTVEMEFDFVCAEDGSVHTVRMFGEAMDSADKATNKAASAAYKYAAFQTFCIPTEGDADATTHESVIQRRAPASPPRARENQAAATGEDRGTHESRSPDGDGQSGVFGQRTVSAPGPLQGDIQGGHTTDSTVGIDGTKAGLKPAPGNKEPERGVAARLPDFRAGSEPADSHTREPGEDDELPAGFALIDDVKHDGKFWHISWGRDAKGGWMVYKTKLAHVADAAQTAYDARVPVKLHSKTLPWLDKVERLDAVEAA